MRDLLFKNLTSFEKKRKILASSEVVEKEGVRSIIHRHFVCIVKEISDEKSENPAPSLQVIKERNHKEQRERFFCKIKGSLSAINQGKLYSVYYLHSLQINLIQIPQDVAH